MTSCHVTIDKYDNLSYTLSMILIGKKEIVAFGRSHPKSRRPLAIWEGIIRQTNYGSLIELKRTFPSADYVHHQYTIFNLSGNKFRLISQIDYSAGVVNVKRIWTHAEYSMKTNEAALRRNMI